MTHPRRLHYKRLRVYAYTAIRTSESWARRPHPIEMLCHDYHLAPPRYSPGAATSHDPADAPEPESPLLQPRVGGLLGWQAPSSFGP